MYSSVLQARQEVRVLGSGVTGGLEPPKSLGNPIQVLWMNRRHSPPLARASAPRAWTLSATSCPEPSPLALSVLADSEMRACYVGPGAMGSSNPRQTLKPQSQKTFLVPNGFSQFCHSRHQLSPFQAVRVERNCFCQLSHLLSPPYLKASIIRSCVVCACECECR